MSNDDRLVYHHIVTKLMFLADQYSCTATSTDNNMDGGDYWMMMHLIIIIASYPISVKCIVLRRGPRYCRSTVHSPLDLTALSGRFCSWCEPLGRSCVYWLLDGAALQKCVLWIWGVPTFIYFAGILQSFFCDAAGWAVFILCCIRQCWYWY